jgi:hypothetical protein
LIRWGNPSRSGRLPFAQTNTPERMDRIRTLDRQQVIKASMVLFAVLAILSFSLAHAAA